MTLSLLQVHMCLQWQYICAYNGSCCERYSCGYIRVTIQTMTIPVDYGDNSAFVTVKSVLLVAAGAYTKAYLNDAVVVIRTRICIETL